MMGQWTGRARGAGKSAPRSRSPRSGSRSRRSSAQTGEAAPRPEGSAQLDVTPLLLLAIATAAIAFDIRALRRGDRFWAPIGLVAVSVAAILGMWDAPAGLFPPGCG